MAKNSEELSVAFLFDDTLDSNDGVAQVVKRLGGWMSGQGHRVSYFVGQTQNPNWQGGKVYSLSRNIRVQFNGNHLSMPLWSSRKNLRAALIEVNPDVVHVQVPYSPFMSQRMINMLPASTAVIGTFHILPSGWLASWGSRLLRLMYGRSLKRFDYISATSPAAAEFAKKAYGIDSQVIANPVSLRDFQLPDLPARQPNHIVFLGRLVKRKGCRQLIEAFAVLKERLPQATLTIAGDGAERPALEKLVQECSLQDSVRFLGFIKESEKAALLATAQVACFPSLYGESFGIVLIEAMAAGSGTVLGGNNPGYRSVLGSQKQLLVDPLDKQSFTHKLYDLLTNSNLQSQIHKWQAEAVKQYDIDVIGSQVIAVYRQAIANRNINRHN